MAVSTLDRRPDPDALLAQTSRPHGRLKVFLGAAPGVGKTYEMLTSARARAREGVDVLIAYVETHGRTETAALLDGLTCLPRRALPYKDRIIEEMDLDALLARRPRLAVIDELAHSNAPGSRHPKRWMDVREVLDAGIDVYSAVNIQHLESLNDVVASITRIRVRETVPDGVIDQADEIELVDLTPADLLQRLREGKVYARANAARAMAHYFSAGNLSALRELALRATAQRVDAQLVTHMRANAISGPWAAGERVLVCVDGAADGDVVRYGRRLADRLHAPWTALAIAPGGEIGSASEARVADRMRLAVSLGAETATIAGRDVAGEIIAVARDSHATQIIIGRPPAEGGLALLGRLAGSRPWTRRLIDGADDIPVHVVGGGDAERSPAAVRRPHDIHPRAVAGSLAVVAGAVVLGMALRHVVSAASVSLGFLIAVLLAGALFGAWPSLVAAFAAAAAFNFFFLPPLYTFTIADPENVATLVFFVIAALIASRLAAGLRMQTVVARQRATVTDSLYQFSRKLVAAASLDELLWATCYQTASLLAARIVVLLPEGARLVLRAGYPPEDRLDDADFGAATWAWQHDREAGRGSDTLPGGRWLFVPLRTARGTMGVLGLDADRKGALLSPEQRRLLDALADQAAGAIERANLAADLDRARVRAETERLQGALLTSISHDLRTPLASILGAASSLSDYGPRLDETARHELLGTIREEAERLNRFVANLLDMTRLESGAVSPRVEPTDIADAVAGALARVSALLAGHRVVLDLTPDLPHARLDPVLFEQVLVNLLDNAAKYAPAGTAVTLSARADDSAIILVVQDEGPGIPASDRTTIFEKFKRLHAADRQRPGTGLGLAIARGFVDAMAGLITVDDPASGRGARFTLRLPMAARPHG